MDAVSLCRMRQDSSECPLGLNLRETMLVIWEHTLTGWLHAGNTPKREWRKLSCRSGEDPGTGRVTFTSNRVIGPTIAHCAFSQSS